MKEQLILEAKPQEKFNRSRLTVRAQKPYAGGKDIFMTDHEDIREESHSNSQQKEQQNPQEKQHAVRRAAETLNETMRSFFENEAKKQEAHSSMFCFASPVYQLRDTSSLSYLPTSFMPDIDP